MLLPKMHQAGLPARIVDVLRAASAPLTSRHLLDAISEAENITEVGTALNQLWKRGIVSREKIDGLRYEYRLAAGMSGEPVADLDQPADDDGDDDEIELTALGKMVVDGLAGSKLVGKKTEPAAAVPPPEDFQLQSDVDLPRRRAPAPQTRFALDLKRRLLLRLSDWTSTDVAEVLIDIERDLAGLAQAR